MRAAIQDGDSQRGGSIWFAGVAPGRRLPEQQLPSPEPRYVAGPRGAAQPGAASCRRAVNRVAVVWVSENDVVAGAMLGLVDDGTRRRPRCRVRTPRYFAESS